MDNPFRIEHLRQKSAGEADVFRGAFWDSLSAVPFPIDDPLAVQTLLKSCPAYAATDLVDLTQLGKSEGSNGEPEGSAVRALLDGTAVQSFQVKNEAQRMGLGSFKALGAAYVIAREADKAVKERGLSASALSTALTGRTFVTASAGNHGLSVAAGARLFGAKAVVVLAQAVPRSFGARLNSFGADAVFEGSDYAASMEAAQKLANEHGWTLLSDSTWHGEMDQGWRVMEGYSVLAQEIVEQMATAPSQIFLHAGVGGLAAASAAVFRRAWGDMPIITVVEPDAAPALKASIEAGKSVFADGPESNMGRLDCKEPSLVALKGLARDADRFITISDAFASETVARLADGFGLHSTPSGIAGVAAARKASLNGSDRVLCIMSEGAVTA